MSFFGAVAACFGKYAEFSGRARRKEYWYFFLFNALVAAVLEIVLGEGNVLDEAYSLITLIPSLAVTWRRMHDIGKSGAWALIFLVPVIGWIFGLIWLFRDSQPYANKYGANPKE